MIEEKIPLGNLNKSMNLREIRMLHMMNHNFGTQMMSLDIDWWCIEVAARDVTCLANPVDRILKGM